MHWSGTGGGFPQVAVRVYTIQQPPGEGQM